MKVKKLTIDEFEIFEPLSAGSVQSYSKHPDEPLIGFSKSHMGLSKKALEFIRATIKDQVVILNKNGAFYLAVISLTSKIKGYNLFTATGGTCVYANFKIEKRGFDVGYYKLLDPIYVGGLDLFELEPFEI